MMSDASLQNPSGKISALVLAAGFGTRMGTLSKKTAKPLLPVAGKPMLQHVASQLLTTGRIQRLYIVTNHFYWKQFEAWAKKCRLQGIDLLDDGATSNETRLGALADLHFTVRKRGIQGPLLVLGGDNLFRFDFADFINFYDQKQTDVVACYPQPDVERLRKTGVAVLDEHSRLIYFQEKPRDPKSHWAIPCLYIFTQASLERLKTYLKKGNPPDAPGHFICWLHTRAPIFAFSFRDPPYSIGDPTSYAKTRRTLEGK
jgi:glucose-1-phosphate thymidylyltransferase